MKATLERIAQEALHLAPAQRADLADFLAESLDSTPPDETQRLWIDEANRRLAEVRSGKVKTIPGEKVLGGVLNSHTKTPSHKGIVGHG